MITVKNLTKFYGDFPAVTDVSFNIEDGHVYGLLGVNGAGKTTTMNMICGSLAPSSGSVRIGSYDLFAEPEKAKALIGYLPEIPPLYPDMTVNEFLYFIAEARRVKKSEIRSHVERINEKTGLTDVSEKLIKNLSKGYRQRVGIAQAIVGDPKTVILDEPTVGLDPRQISEIRALIRELGRTRTVLISSHILSEISELCDRILIISEGKLIASGTQSELCEALGISDRLVLNVKAPVKRAIEVMKGLGRIGKVSFDEISDSVCEISIVAGERDIREDIFFAFASAKLPIISMEMKHSSLEDIFMIATTPSEDSHKDGEDSDQVSDSIPSISSFFRSASVKKESRDSDGEDDDDEGYKPLFGRK